MRVTSRSGGTSDPADLDDGAALAPAPPAEEEGEQQQEHPGDDAGRDHRVAGRGDLVAGVTLQLAQLGLDVVPGDAVPRGGRHSHRPHLLGFLEMRVMAHAMIRAATAMTMKY